ncbi:DUF116 domain-containing protein [Carboxydothermus hydrogenoformans]|uniref:DUF116 domain-containing protein n=1 Tax=Carboxydothermus hydrogenoformans (strain ATCC BAA-161 / DSM 6008 / Z-2901) TaxID=246194 RepID=Q3AC20_CARHZ|nr:DUF116 domain-containing protein [Carboxydothermus hydrogenoformans]ABB13846.1 conserved hypothetical protein [Carboxydothermus hydrogenoformans Z-2901]
MLNFYKQKIFIKSLFKRDVRKDIQKYISLMNDKTLKYGPFSPEKVLLLLPHCLQKADCLYKITYDVHNCRECFRCPVGVLKCYARERGLKIAVAAGGTAARQFVKSLQPEVVFAVACEGDLFSGMNDIPVLSLGLINLRPKGPCFETLIEYDKFYYYLNRLIW